MPPVSEEITTDDLDAATQRAVEVLRGGGLAVLPTDTVYALVADAFQTDATQRLLAAKGRGRLYPVSIMIRNPRQVIGLASDTPEIAERLMASYWPGPVSIVLPEQPEMPWDLGNTEGAVTLRMPADDLLLAVAAEVGPLACSGANLRGSPAPTTLAAAREQLGEAVDLYVDGGSREAPMTTVVDCTREVAHVLREGAVPAEDILTVAAGEIGWGQLPERRPDDKES